MKIYIIILSLLFVSCSSINKTTEIRSENKSILIPEIVSKNIPGIINQEVPIDELFTGEVINGEVKDSLGKTIVEIQYRPKKIIAPNYFDTVGVFSAIIKPPSVQVPTKITTQTVDHRISLFDKVQDFLWQLFAIMIILIILIIICKFIMSI
jgi:hypothetical protein